MVKHIRHELEERAEKVREMLALEEQQREAMRLRGKTALEHANYLLTEVERSLKSEGAAQSLDGASTERGFRRPAPLAPIRPDTAER